MRQTLHLVAPINHQGFNQLDCGRVFGVEIKHGRSGTGIKFFLALFAQQISHRHRDIAKININRAGVLAFVAYRAVIGHIGKLIEVSQRYAATGLLFIQKSFDQKRGAENFISRRIQQIRPRDMSCTYGLAFAAAQAIFD